MQLRRRWQACGWLLVSLSLVSMTIFTGCEKTGGGGGGTATTPTSGTTPPSTTPPPAGVAIVDIGGITLATGEDSLIADGTSSTTITATLVNSAGSPSPDGINVTFTTDKGRFTPEGAKSAAATTRAGTGIVVVPFISELDVVGTATIAVNANGVANSTQIALVGPGEPSRIILTVDATTIPLGGTTGITAQVLDDEGNAVADGTAVIFTTNLTGTAVTPTVTTSDGTATAIFSAGTSAGVATVTATADSASAKISITIQSGPAGSLEFVSAVPTVIGVIGSALPQKSTLTFRAGDVNGNAVTDGTLVTFTLISGVNGGEKVEPTQVGTTAGLASTVLTSGIVSGPVRVQASVTVGGITLTSSSTNVSIAGGTPSAAHMGVAPAFLNIAGLVTQGIICPITAIVGDRFGNPIPQNTAVSFSTNGGVIGAQGLTDELGNAPTEIKTGPPTPRIINSGDPTFNPDTDPRTGFVSIAAMTQGEETFIDSNGNGLFDGPQEFDPNDPDLDTPEPFIDHVTLCNGNLPSSPIPCPPDPANPPALSGDGQFDPTDRFELFFDGNGNGAWDTPNDVWDANKPIFATTRVLFSGRTVLRVGRLQGNGTCLTKDVDPVNGDPNGFVAPNGGFADKGLFCIVVSDPAGHPLVGGTTITITSSKGVIIGTSDVTIPDTQLSGPGITLFSFTVGDSDARTSAPEAAVVTITVESAQVECPGGNGSVADAFGGQVN